MIKDDDSTEVETAVGRRALFRGGVVLAGASGISVVGASLLAGPAEAATGDNLLVGKDNEADSTTRLTFAPSSSPADSGLEPALALTNEGGPSLYLNPLAEDWNGNLEPGQILNTERGPLIGIIKDGENLTTELLTKQDVWLPFVLATPMRLVDTRTEEGRLRLTQPSPLSSDGRLPAHTELTFWISPAGEGFGLPAVNLNLTVVGPKANGYAVVYPGPDRPETSTVNFTKGRTVANSAFIGTSNETVTVVIDPSQPPETAEAIVIKVYTSAAAWIVIDGTAAVATGFNPTEQTGANGKSASKRPSPAALAQRSFGKLR